MIGGVFLAKLTVMSGAELHSQRASVDGARIAFLDYLRIFAFMSVIVGHMYAGYLYGFVKDPSQHPTPKLVIRLSSPWFNEGGAGVVVFFLISGYIITYVLSRETTGSFLIRRIFRIYPLYLFAVLLKYLLDARSGSQQSLPVLIQQGLLIGDFTGSPFSLNNVEWTLRIEVLFYLFMAMVDFSGRKIKAPTNRNMIYFYIFVVIFLGFLPPFTDGRIGWGPWPATGTTNLYFPFLLIGSGFYLLENGFSSMPSFLVLVFAWGIQYYALMPRYQRPWSTDHHAAAGLALFAVVWIFRDRFKINSFILFAASLAYGMYLFHNWWAVFIRSFLVVRGVHPLLGELIAFLILVLTCVVSLFLVEKPGIRLGRRIAASLAPGRKSG